MLEDFISDDAILKAYEHHGNALLSYKPHSDSYSAHLYYSVEQLNRLNELDKKKASLTPEENIEHIRLQFIIHRELVDMYKFKGCCHFYKVPLDDFIKDQPGIYEQVQSLRQKSRYQSICLAILTGLIIILFYLLSL